MIKQVQEFVEDFWEEHGPLKKVLDVGSLDVSKTGTIRDFIPGHKKYVGLDMRKGKNVDIVMNAHDMSKKWKRPIFGLVTCVDTLEHDLEFWRTVKNMRSVLKPGGWLLITVPSLAHPRHNHPSDYYRFFETVFNEVFFEGYEDVHVKTMAWGKAASENSPDEILGYGRKPK